MRHDGGWMVIRRITGSSSWVVAPGVRLYLGDCLGVLHNLSVGSIDAVVADPPYGVGFTGKRGHYRNQPGFKKDGVYANYEDTEENWLNLIRPRIDESITRSKAAAFFMGGRRIFDMPRGGDVGGIFLPSGTGVGSWGFQNFMHVCFYGKCPFTARGMGSRPNGKYGLYGNDSNKVKHPCAKPLAAMKWLVERVSMPGDTVLDPFMGSGTTGVACVETGRNFIGVEIDPTYFQTAWSRIVSAVGDRKKKNLVRGQ